MAVLGRRYASRRARGAIAWTLGFLLAAAGAAAEAPPVLRPSAALDGTGTPAGPPAETPDPETRVEAAPLEAPAEEEPRGAAPPLRVRAEIEDALEEAATSETDLETESGAMLETEAEAREAAFPGLGPLLRARAASESDRAALLDQALGNAAGTAAALEALLREGTLEEAHAAAALLETLTWRAGRPGALDDARAWGRALMGLLPGVRPEAPRKQPPDRPNPRSLWDAMAALAEAGGQAAHEASEEHQRALRREGLRARTHRDILAWVASLPHDDLVPDIAAYLRDHELGEAAVQALVRIGGDSAVRALAAGLSLAPYRLHPDIARGLGALRAQGAVQALTEHARAAGQGPLMWESLTALSRLGVPPTAAAPRRPDFDRADLVVYAMCGLRAAQELEARGERVAAENLYLRYMDLYARRMHQRAAIAGLARLASPHLVRQALGYINTPGVRETAVQALIEARGAGINDELEQAYRITDPVTRAALLQVLAAREAEALPALLQEALLSESPELRAAAAAIAGLEIGDDELLELARRGAPWLRGDALDRFLARAEANQARGLDGTAFTQFAAALESGFPAEQQRRALRALARIDLAGARDAIERAINRPELRETAYAALLAWHTGRDPGQRDPEAVRELAARAPNLYAAAHAAEALEAMGLDAGPFARRWGSFTAWRLLGPFPARQEAPLEKAYFPEQRGDLHDVAEYGGAPFTWRAEEAAGIPAALDLRRRFPGNEAAIVYAATQFVSPDWRQAELRIACSGPFALWFNGERVHAEESARAYETDAVRVRVRPRPGVNRVMVKTLGRTEDWRVSVRLTDRGGNPIDLDGLRAPFEGLAEPEGVGARADALLPTLADDAP